MQCIRLINFSVEISSFFFNEAKKSLLKNEFRKSLTKKSLNKLAIIPIVTKKNTRVQVATDTDRIAHQKNAT